MPLLLQGDQIHSGVIHKATKKGLADLLNYLAVLKHTEEHHFIITQLVQLRTQTLPLSSTFGVCAVLESPKGSLFFS